MNNTLLNSKRKYHVCLCEGGEMDVLSVSIADLCDNNPKNYEWRIALSEAIDLDGLLDMPVTACFRFIPNRDNPSTAAIITRTR